MRTTLSYGTMLGRDLLTDTRGFIISAELVVISSLLVVGLMVGLSAVQQSVNAEMLDVAGAIGSLNQSYGYTGMSARRPCDCGIKSFTTGSCFIDLKDDCDLEQCELVGDQTTICQELAVVPHNNSLDTTAVVPRTEETAVIHQESRLDQNITPVPDSASGAIAPIPENDIVPHNQAVVPPAPEAGCGCVQHVDPCPAACVEKQTVANSCQECACQTCGHKCGDGCHKGCGSHAVGWGGLQSEYPYPYPAAMLGCRPAPFAYGGVESSPLGDYTGFSGSYRGNDGYQPLDRSGYYRILIPEKR